MTNKIFEIKDIITIVLASVEEIESKALYGIEEEAYLPAPIKGKLEKVKDSEKFWSIIDEITEEIYEGKTGELNNLNVMHNEINYLASEKLKEYLI